MNIRSLAADGTTSLVLSPTELIEKLAALVPPPRANVIRYHGVLAPAAAARAQSVPGPSALTAPEAAPDAHSGSNRRPRVECATLLARVVQAGALAAGRPFLNPA